MQKLLVAFIFLPCAAMAQFSVSVSTGYGSWSMKSMKDWQQEFKDAFPVEAQTTSSFPAYWYFEASGMQRTDEWIRGLIVSHGSTGGRVYYSDYSGRTGVDHALSFYGLSAIIGRLINKSPEKYLIAGSLRPGVFMSKMSYRYEQVVFGTERESASDKFTSLNLTIQPTLTVTKKFGAFGVEALAGYHLTVVSGKLSYDEDGDVAYLLNKNGGPVKSSWSGVRLALGLSFDFGK